MTTSEKASSQSHFIDLCRMLGEPTAHEADPTGESYAFEKRVTKGGEGTASRRPGRALGPLIAVSHRGRRFTLQ